MAPVALLGLAASPAWAAFPGRGEHQQSRLEVKYDGNPKQLEFFLAQVWHFMYEYRMYVVGNLAEYAALLRPWRARQLNGFWLRMMMTLRSCFNNFMLALRQRFKESLMTQKAMSQIKFIRQGKRPIVAYIQNFWSLASQ